MYEAFFGMKHTPFTRDIPVEKLYSSIGYEEALGRLVYASERQLFAVLTANVGCGKTTIIRSLSEKLDKDLFTMMYISDSKLTPRWLYKGMLEQLGIDAKFYRGDSRRQLHKELEIQKCVYNKRLVCCVDESHLLDRETLEEVRFLLNSNFDSQSPMALILIGQNELWDKFKLQQYAAIRQRIDIRCHLPELDRSQTGAYIEQHLKFAGVTDIFTDKAVEEIYRYSAGSLRSINRASTHALIYASQHAKRLVDDHMMRDVIENELP
jgi:general secretion pathway protein A